VGAAVGGEGEAEAAGEAEAEAERDMETAAAAEEAAREGDAADGENGCCMGDDAA